MGVIGGAIRGVGAVASLGRAARGLSEVFVPNATAGQALGHAAREAALEQLGAEFELPERGRFDRAVDGLNRLPRPFLAFGTLGLLVHAMVEPVSFAARMEGLGHVPEPLWWLLGAIVGFYFGARELHHRRAPRASRPVGHPAPVHSAWIAPERPDAAENAALAEWEAMRSTGTSRPVDPTDAAGGGVFDENSGQSLR